MIDENERSYKALNGKIFSPFLEEVIFRTWLNRKDVNARIFLPGGPPNINQGTESPLFVYIKTTVMDIH